MNREEIVQKFNIPKCVLWKHKKISKKEWDRDYQIFMRYFIDVIIKVLEDNK